MTDTVTSRSISWSTDRRAGVGRSYLVESSIQPGDHLRSLVADYKRQAAELGHCPMSPEALEVLLARGSRVREAVS